MTTSTCPVCATTMSAQKLEWLSRCDECGFLQGDLRPDVNGELSDDVDETAREDALDALRHRNFKVVLDELEPLTVDSPRLLDVGCAHGWFLELAAERGYSVTGLEPDIAVATATKARGLPVLGGFFPSALPEGAQFDVISFHDVLEHIPGPDRVFGEVHQLLADEGLLVVNVPVSTGIFYRTSTLLSRFGFHGPIRRMWQVMFPSPHVSYFKVEHIRTLGATYGFSVVAERRLASISVRGLWPRLRYDRNSSVAAALATYVATLCAWPFMAVLPNDIALVVLRKDPGRKSVAGGLASSSRRSGAL